MSFAVLMASLAPVVVEGSSAVVPLEEPALIVADAGVEFSARGIMITWRMGFHLLLFLLSFLLWFWRSRRETAPRREDLENVETDEHEGG